MSDQAPDLMVLPEEIGEGSPDSKSREMGDEGKGGDTAAGIDVQPMDDSVHTAESKFVIFTVEGAIDRQLNYFSLNQFSGENTLNLIL